MQQFTDPDVARHRYIAREAHGILDPADEMREFIGGEVEDVVREVVGDAAQADDTCQQCGDPLDHPLDRGGWNRGLCLLCATGNWADR